MNTKKLVKVGVFLGLQLIFISTAFSASITGQVIYDGKKPKLRPIKMDADPICLTHHSGEVVGQSITLGENNEMANVFIHIAEGVPNKDYPTPTEPVVLDQKGCMYDPPIFGIQVGQPLKILNPDGTLHNVHCLSKKNPEFNLAMPKFRKETTKTFKEEEFMFQIKCDVHPWMVTYGNVLKHPFYNVTGDDGKFTIDNLPAGTYVIEAVQQRLDPKRVSVTLAEGETKEVNFSFSRPGKK